MSPIEFLAWPFDVIQYLGAGGFAYIVFLVWAHFRVAPTVRDRNGWPEHSVDIWEYKRWQKRHGRKP